jgi:hypothetical protein
MCTLRLEELESRDLLSSGFAAVLPFPGHSGSADSRVSYVSHEPLPSSIDKTHPMGGFGAWTVDFNSDIGEQPGHGGSMMELTITIIVVRFVTVVEQPTPNPGENDSGSDATPAVAPAAVNPKPTGNENSVSLTPADAGANRAAVSTPTATRVTAATPVMIVAPPVGPTGAAEATGAVAQLPPRTFRVGDFTAGAAPAWLGQTPTAAGSVVTPPESDEPPEAGPTALIPVEQAALASLPVIDLAALGRNLQQFVSQLEHVGEELVGPGDGLRPWIIAGAAAATACEIARRQLKKTDDRGQKTILRGLVTDV